MSILSSGDVPLCPPLDDICEMLEYRGEGNSSLVLGHKIECVVYRLLKSQGHTRNADNTAVIPVDRDSITTASAQQKCQLDAVWLNDMVNYSRYIMQPLLGTSYITPGQVLHIEPKFLQAIIDFVQPLRPVNRRHKNIDIGCHYAIRLPDYTKLSCSSHTQSSVLCIEIKPKSGILPFTSYYPVKTKVCRYEMMQYYKCQQGHISAISRYCPIDLFSDELTRVIKALKFLIEMPQNNLKIFRDGHLVYGTTTGTNLPLKDISRFLYFDDERSNEEEAEDFLMLIAACLLDNGNKSSNGNVLHNILRAQSLGGHLDVEGIFPIYEALHRYLVDHPEQKELFCLDGPYGTDWLEYNDENIVEQVLESLHHNNEKGRNAKCSMKNDLNYSHKPACNNVSSLHDNHPLSSHQAPDSTGHDVFPSNGQNGRNARDLAVCDSNHASTNCFVLPEDVKSDAYLRMAQLVKKFLVAQTAKDCTVMLTVQRVCAAELSDATENSCCQILKDHRGRAFRFRIGIVDVDPKSFDKIPSYYLQDREIVENYIRMKRESLEDIAGCD